MPVPMHDCKTAEDYWALPESVRAELVDGELYDMAPPSIAHQKLAGGIYRSLANHIEAVGGPCLALLSPVAVNLNADDTTYVEPDVLVVCDPEKLSDRACEGAPDLTVEVVSPSSQRMDYLTKADRYARAGVREYWIVDPQTRKTAVYRYERGDVVPTFYPFETPVPVGIWDDGFAVAVAQLA